ncbi:hypothetical protein [Undibacterium pigrum]|uniref:Uncharacterized protein n=1 Tax=Undibacterium pigrum TaxID=401470 RepID=A0A318JJ27_9BURK|nr:hypothetical protein [Undibacterium pigrum]PXX47162.1 hypothetical protein DFR42_101738 [Undibacterium pigrum]
MKSILIATAITVTAGLTIWQLWPQAEDTPPRQQATSPSSSGKLETPDNMRTATWPPPFPERNDERKFVALLPTGPEISAAQSLVATRDGDSRTPPIAHSQITQEMPTAAELADPKAYQQYEARQNTRLYAAYVLAADEEIPRLREAIARARDMGIAPADIAKGEEKLRRITAMQGQLLNEHPELQNGTSTKSGLK